MRPLRTRPDNAVVFFSRCDRIVLLANDHQYGGLGDDVAIVTASRASGALALRHELGHTLGDFGEE